MAVTIRNAGALFVTTLIMSAGDHAMDNRCTRIRQLTVLSIIGVKPAVAFNRIWPCEGILTAVPDELIEFHRSPHERPIQTTAISPCIGHPGHG